MSKWRERYKSAKSKTERGGSDAADFDEMPLLSEALAGVRTEKGDAWEVPPHSLTLWLEGSVAKFVLGAQDDDVKTFGTFPGLSSGLLGVEKALADGNCETKKVPKQLTSFSRNSR
jgi:hypothetical protein